MTTTSDFYMQQAIRDEEAAAAATLDNVRERCLRSAEAWRHMAERVSRAQTMRATLDAEKAAARAESLVPDE
jgi:hypothetical protein